MNILIDTHILLWSLFEPKKLSKKQRQALIDKEHDIHVSPISLWEISLKYSLGKLNLQKILPEELISYIEESGFYLTSTTPATHATYYQLPRIGHKDPFDRMLIWQAISQDWHLMSRDSSLTAYQKSGLNLF
jgi:PIN domain nuclease of toxin-antitoxin system